MYDVIISKKVLKQIHKIKDIREAKAIEKLLKDLEVTPFLGSSKKMNGYKETYRCRIGNYRIIYELVKLEKKIIILAVESRQNIYKNLHFFLLSLIGF